MDDSRLSPLVLVTTSRSANSLCVALFVSMTIFRKREVRQCAGIGSPGDGWPWTGPLATCHKLVYRILIQPTPPRVGIGTTSAIGACRRMARQFMPLWLRLAGANQF